MSIYIIINGIKLVKEASSPLIGEPPSKEFTEELTMKNLAGHFFWALKVSLLYLTGALQTMQLKTQFA